MSKGLPGHVSQDLQRAARLEWWTIGWMASVIIVMAALMGSSQAMRSALIEDILSIVPAIVFLIARRIERRPPTPLFPYGFARANSIAFAISAVALVSVGATLIVEAGSTLIKQEHVTIAPIRLFGRDIWQGWLMIAALVYSIVPPVILGRMKEPIARRLSDKVLHTDALMQRADWQTGIAGIAGIVGVGLGYWWADAAAALLIAVSILKDGSAALGKSVAELIDGAPRDLTKSRIDPEALALLEAVERRFPGAQARARETGRMIHVQLLGAPPPEGITLSELWPGDPDRAWRFAELSFVPPETRFGEPN